MPLIWRLSIVISEDASPPAGWVADWVPLQHAWVSAEASSGTGDSVTGESLSAARTGVADTQLGSSWENTLTSTGRAGEITRD